LRTGGYPIKGTVDEKRVRLTILKNTANFVLLPDDYFMLKPKGIIRKPKQATTEKGESYTEETSEKETPKG